MAASDFMNYHASADEAVPALVKIPITALRPLRGLKENHLLRVRLGPVQIGGRMNDCIQFTEVVLAYLQTQRMVDSPTEYAYTKIDSLHPIPEELRRAPSICTAAADSNEISLC